uniref:Uncharacterized protein n=1 Tax=Strongyloides stercoralis TaxID=6248 RepID=A0AAF5DJ11_STRER
YMKSLLRLFYVEVNEPLLKKALQLEKDAALLKDLAGNLNEKKEKLKEKWQKTNYNDSKDKHLEGVGHKTNDLEVNKPLLEKALQLERDAELLNKLAGNLNDKKEKLKEKMQETTNKKSKDKHLEGVGHKTNDRRKLGSKYQKFAEKFGGFKN